jgi:hypothetical protein
VSGPLLRGEKEVYIGIGREAAAKPSPTPDSDRGKPGMLDR